MKIAGVLIESSSSGEQIKSVRIGIGLNINQNGFPEGIPATSMRLVLGQQVDYFLVLKALTKQIMLYLKRYEVETFSGFAEEYRKLEWKGDMLYG